MGIGDAEGILRVIGAGHVAASMVAAYGSANVQYGFACFVTWFLIVGGLRTVLEAVDASTTYRTTFLLESLDGSAATLVTVTFGAEVTDPTRLQRLALKVMGPLGLKLTEKSLAGVALTIASKGMTDAIFADLLAAFAWLMVMDWIRRAAYRQAGSSLGGVRMRTSDFVHVTEIAGGRSPKSRRDSGRSASSPWRSAEGSCSRRWWPTCCRATRATSGISSTPSASWAAPTWRSTSTSSPSG